MEDNEVPTSSLFTPPSAVQNKEIQSHPHGHYIKSNNEHISTNETEHLNEGYEVSDVKVIVQGLEGTNNRDVNSPPGENTNEGRRYPAV